ncbi:MAG: hypothetical protein LAT64_13345 [Phycisphaerales bacterium]|nr:hypothetical protein [Planctomycetota bacterium]MCH8509740.1 hypothetical protein [Phycisphaerales bacterium]
MPRRTAAPLYLLVALAGSAQGQTVSYSPFTVTTPNDSGANTLQSMLLPGGVMQPGTAYNFFRINFDWTPDLDFNARQWNAIWALTDAPAGPGATFYADPGPSTNAAITLVPQFQPGNISWVGAFNTPVPGGNDLYFNWAQFDAFTGTTWSNIELTLDARQVVTSTFSGDTSNAPTWTRFRDPREGAGDFPSLITNIRYEATPFYVDTDGIYQFRTSTNGQWNGVIAIYQDSFDPANPNANRIDLWAGTAPGTTPFGDRTIAFDLEADRQYFFLQTGRRSADAGAYTGTVAGFGGVTFAIIPSPGATGILAGLGLIAARRRR